MLEMRQATTRSERLLPVLWEPYGHRGPCSPSSLGPPACFGILCCCRPYPRSDRARRSSAQTFLCPLRRCASAWGQVLCPVWPDSLRPTPFVCPGFCQLCPPMIYVGTAELAKRRNFALAVDG